MAVHPTKQRVPIDMGLLEIINHRFEQLGTDPAAITNGRIWYNTVQHRTKRFENGIVVPFFSAADAIKLAGYQSTIDQAEVDIIATNAVIESITSNNILSKYEKPVIKSQYDLLIAEQIGIDEIATLYEITTEKTTYDDSLTALTSYLVSLDPLYTDYTQDTIIDGALFRQLFADIYAARQLLANAMSDYAHTTLDTAMAIANEAKTTADNAAADAAEALASIGIVISDSILARIEKPGIVQQYTVLVAEKTGIDAQATAFGITTEKTAYDNAVTALTAYITGLNPAYNDYSQDTVIVRGDFNDAFELVFSTKQILFNAIYSAAKLLADNAAIIARSKGKHFISEPTTPYYVGDIYTNEIDLYRCIVERLTGAYNAADWEPATHYDRTQTTIDGGIVTTGRIGVGNAETENAGMNGSVSGTPTTDIRFWAGANYANRSTAPWRVQDNGEFWGTSGHIGGWNIDTDSMFSGTKLAGDGFTANAGDMTIKSNGSFHSKNFFINADGNVGLAGVMSFKTTPDSYIATKIQGGDIWEDDWDNDNATIGINFKGYNGGYTRFRNFSIGDGKGVGMFHVNGQNKLISNLYPVVIKDSGYWTGSTNPDAILDLQSYNKAFILPRMTSTQRNAMTAIAGMMVYDTTVGKFAGHLGTGGWGYMLMEGT